MGGLELILLALGDDSSLSIALRRELIHVDRVEAAVQLAQLVVRLAHLGLLASDIKLGRDILKFGILHLTEGHGLVVIYFGEKIRLNFQHVDCTYFACQSRSWSSGRCERSRDGREACSPQATNTIF